MRKKLKSENIILKEKYSEIREAQHQEDSTAFHITWAPRIWYSTGGFEIKAPNLHKERKGGKKTLKKEKGKSSGLVQLGIGHVDGGQLLKKNITEYSHLLECGSNGLQSPTTVGLQFRDIIGQTQ